MPGFGTPAGATAAAPTVDRSPWKSPIPYLFGGLAAMLGLIAMSLLILACSYWKFSGYVENRSVDGERDVEAEGEGNRGENPAPEEKFLVIMAGQEKPTFLATARSSRATSFNSSISCEKSSESSVD